ncbi:MAG: DegV family protein [Anaerolineae bacterium]|nr:DegV family protein [Anaerolineae bacterium]
MPPTAPVAVVTDSAAGMSAALLQQYRISVVPYWVHMGEEAYLSGETMAPPAFFRMLRERPEMEVHTGVPGIAKFVEIYERLATWAKGIVSIHVAGKQSGTYDAAQLASEQSPVPVAVLDTETTAMAEGFVVLEAAREAAAGSSLAQVVAKAESVIPNVGLIALLESITYALKGGRLSSAASKVGSLLHIQPLIRVRANRVSLMGQARRRSKGLETLLEQTVAEVRDDPAHITVHFAEDEAEGQQLLDAIRARINCVESYLMRVPVELGVHAGPGSIGVAYYVERETVGLAQQIEQKLGQLGSQAKEAIRSRFSS